MKIKKLNLVYTMLLSLLMLLSFSSINAHAKIRLPEPSGTNVAENDKAIIDYSNSDQGYVMVKYKGSNSKVKVQVIGKETYNYDVIDEWDAFPLTDGDRTYTIRVMENVAGNRYSMALNTDVHVSLSDPLLPFLYSHQRVNFDSATTVVKKAAALVKGKKKDLDKVSAIYNWVIGYYKYDYSKAKTVKAGYIPDLDHIYKVKKGICYDYASTTAAMLRSQGIPTKMVFGYIGETNEYHAWISVYLKESGWVNNIIQFREKAFTLMDPTFASGGSKDPKKYTHIQKSVY